MRVAKKKKKKKRTGKNLLKRILRLCPDPQWKAELVIQEIDRLLQCALENSEQARTPLLQRKQSFPISKLGHKRVSWK